MVNTNPKMKVVREEIFGPVVVASPFSDIDKLVAEATKMNTGWRREFGQPTSVKTPHCREAARRHGVDQLLQRLRRRAALGDTSSRAGP